VALGREGKDHVAINAANLPRTAAMADKMRTDPARKAYRRRKHIDHALRRNARALVMLTGASLAEGGWWVRSNMLEVPLGGGSGELCIHRWEARRLCRPAF
jgi:hypothetical protein